jgi:hypothetical protein
MSNRFLLIPLVLFAVMPVFSAEKPTYQTATLVDLSSRESGAGAGRGQRIFCLAVETDDLDYTLYYWPNWRGSYTPTDLVVGDTIEININKDHLYIKKKNGGELKTDIVRRERRVPDKKPTTCALPVSTQN